MAENWAGLRVEQTVALSAKPKAALTVSWKVGSTAVTKAGSSVPRTVDWTAGQTVVSKATN